LDDHLSSPLLRAVMDQGREGLHALEVVCGNQARDAAIAALVQPRIASPGWIGWAVPGWVHGPRR